MFKQRLSLAFLSIAVVMAATPSAHAAMAVVDVRAIAQAIQQVRALQNQLQTARSHLSQAQAEFQSMTGGRGMERLLSGVTRDYLPPDWNGLSNLLDGIGSTYSLLMGQLNGLMDQNRVMSQRQFESLSPRAQQQVLRDRKHAAMVQVTAREALSNTSARFAAVQQLINAIPTATDQKAILDLQARIAAEQAMLQNEQTKLQMLDRTLQAEEVSRRQRLREQALADIGSLRELEPLRLPGS